jgi:flavin reductase (DIM6/NTAB) family NADH-FMN oxidoreductase RutF
LKKQIGAVNSLYPMPTTIVGALVNTKPNYITIAHVGIMDLGSISLGMNKVHYTNIGIKENGTFSVNIPSVHMVKQTDYCGLVSGRNFNKATLFRAFYGKLKTAPMIEECPINMECELVKTVDFPNHDVFVGKIIATYSDDNVLTGDAVDFEKVQPILFSMNNQDYWRLGERLAKAWNIGKELTNQ